MERLSRRACLRALAACGATGLAGCLGLSGGCDAGDETFEPTVDDNSGGTVPTVGSEWPLRYGDSAGTSFTAAPGPREGVGRVWTIDPWDGPGGSTWPVVAGGRLHVAGVDEDQLYTLDPVDESMTWTYPLDSGSPVAVDDGTVVVGDENGVHALDAATGERRWQFGGEFDGDGTVLASYGTVYASAGLTTHAVDLERGAERWSVEDSHVGAVADGRVYLGQSVRAVDVSTGEDLWTRGDVKAYGAVAVRGDTAYVGELGRLHALDAADGSEEWTFEGETEEFESPAVTGDTVVAGSTLTEAGGGNVYALDHSGDERWCADFGFREVAAVAVGGDAVFVAANELLQARNLRTGDVLWTHRDDDREYQSLAVAGSTLYAGAYGGRVDVFAES